ncbi:MAG: bifunctional pyr operon transcriptional regulator/uracil phosphoribosyltransferase PyrR [Candidatus Aminicenantes bacterium]|jgi:pyrimidine operon attenuation protein/uracil phosphoribosyltransferase|nr:bifunctional pyr operon transcriptional regulator/uracil phosphoribosyltransferase PyrR [Candidatus Aminicenantes bacterium]MDH5466039.1 bifunctional pyr operon transcriptional regulator/uracil phosphoribosyltransferase PyrR [Candidatus Aminicenantes bacterium]MDH5704986.1 bifunctional pyr operon transcriptional regulator/uracil phosphoribosyltransferase PyrR [Candidatus Aminicenantes bacterium]
MKEKIKARIMDSPKIKRALDRMTTEIIERNRNLKNLVIVGIRTRGIYVGKRISKLIKDMEKVDIPVGVLDITLYRDDFSELEAQHMVKKTEINFPVVKKDILLVDDVLFTGRTIRAAMDSLIDLGRPKTIQLLVLIDRGHRELPIRADYVGKFLPTSKRENVQVHLKEIDNTDEVLITEPPGIK